MKKIIVFYLLLAPLLSYSQYGYGFLTEFFFARVPSARAEAMGKSYASIDGDMTTAYFNPAGAATIERLEFNYSYASPLYFADKANYNYFNVGGKIKDWLIIGISRNHFSFQKEVSVLDQSGNIVGQYVPTTSNYTLTISSQPIKNLFLGLNTSYFIWKPTDQSGTTMMFDFGIIKKFQLSQSVIHKHVLNIGTSITNFSFSKISTEIIGTKVEKKLPVITRLGANYQYTFNKQLLIGTLNTLGFLIQGEYQNVLNSSYLSAFRTGAEITLLETLSIRIGYYIQKENDYGFPNYNRDELRSFTYGFGVQLALYKLSKIPIKINFDYMSLEQPPYTYNDNELENFTSYNVRLVWVFKNHQLF